MNAVNIQPYSRAVVKLLKGIVEKDDVVWNDLLDYQSEIQDYISVMGLELIVKKDEGFAFVKQMKLDEDKTLNMVSRRSYGFEVSVRGFMAVCVTDFIQGMLMLVALLAVPLMAYAVVSGNGGLRELLDASGVAGGSDSYMSLWQNGGEPYRAIDIISQLAWGLGYCGMPHILTRFMAVKSQKELNKSKGIAIVWVALSLTFACIIGVVGRAYLYPEVLGSAGADSAENVFINMITHLFTKQYALPFVAGIFLCGILAAIMSTADSQLLVTASSVSEDIYKGVVNKEASDKKVLMVSRITVVVVAIIAYIIALNPNNSIMGLVSNAWAGFGAAFGPLVVLSLFWKRTNKPGAIAGIVSGGVAVIIWDYIPLMKNADGAMVTLGTGTGIYSLLVGFFLSLICIVIVSLCTKAPNEEMQKEFADVADKSIEL